MTEAAESARANAALAVRLAIAASGPVIAGERLWCSFGVVLDTASVPAVVTEALWPSFAALVRFARVSASIESIAFIERPASRVIPRMVESRVVVMPIETPVVPAPPVAPKESDAEATSEGEERTVIPDAWIPFSRDTGVARSVPLRKGENGPQLEVKGHARLDRTLPNGLFEASQLFILSTSANSPARESSMIGSSVIAACVLSSGSLHTRGFSGAAIRYIHAISFPKVSSAAGL
jgi:hypothetical protein